MRAIMNKISIILDNKRKEYGMSVVKIDAVFKLVRKEEVSFGQRAS